MASQPETVKAEVMYLGNPPEERPYWGSPLSGVGCNIQVSPGIATPYRFQITSLFPVFARCD